jgi:TolA-binding protein
MLRKAYCLERMGSTATALNTYREIIERYPKEYTAPEALVGTGRIYEARREYPAARAAYNRVVGDYPDSHKVVEAKSLIQALTAKEQEWERVKAELGRLSERYPRRERKDGEGM